jgi:hypothetical protein
MPVRLKIQLTEEEKRPTNYRDYSRQLYCP